MTTMILLESCIETRDLLHIKVNLMPHTGLGHAGWGNYCLLKVNIERTKMLVLLRLPVRPRIYPKEELSFIPGVIALGVVKGCVKSAIRDIKILANRRFQIATAAPQNG